MLERPLNLAHYLELTRTWTRRTTRRTRTTVDPLRVILHLRR